MRTMLVRYSLIAVFLSVATGCQSGPSWPQWAWWNGRGKPESESTALAKASTPQIPELPSAGATPKDPSESGTLATSQHSMSSYSATSTNNSMTAKGQAGATYPSTPYPSNPYLAAQNSTSNPAYSPTAPPTNQNPAKQAAHAAGVPAGPYNPQAYDQAVATSPPGTLNPWSNNTSAGPRYRTADASTLTASTPGMSSASSSSIGSPSNDRGIGQQYSPGNTAVSGNAPISEAYPPSTQSTSQADLSQHGALDTQRGPSGTASVTVPSAASTRYATAISSEIPSATTGNAQGVSRTNVHTHTGTSSNEAIRGNFRPGGTSDYIGRPGPPISQGSALPNGAPLAPANYQQPVGSPMPQAILIPQVPADGASGPGATGTGAAIMTPHSGITPGRAYTPPSTIGPPSPAAKPNYGIRSGLQG